jgi:hypothetical protein
MRFGTLLTMILCVGLGTVIAVPSSPSDQNKISQLIAKLGSENFRERDAASKELDAIGEPALEALQKAAKSTDMETANRATALVGRIQQRGENARLLAPTYVELNLKEATIDDAVAELAKKSGFTIILGGDKTKMSDRRVTLETGRVPFWKALDMLCEQAGLVEGDANTPLPAVDLPFQPVPPQIQPLPIRIQPIKPINVKPIQVKPIQVKPAPKQAPAEKPVEDKPEPKPEKPLVPDKFAPDPALQKEEVPAQPAQANPPVQIAPAVQPVQPAQPIQGGAIGGRRPPVGVGANGQLIVLVDGKPNRNPADLESAFRIRAINDANMNGNFGPIPEGEIQMILEVRPEPRLQLQQLLGVKIDKAIDNHDQVLTPTMVSSLPVDPNNATVDQLRQLKVMQQIQVQGGRVQIIGGPTYPASAYGNSYVPARLKKADKEPKSLKEVRGTVSLKLRTGNEELVGIDNILKAKGETAKGKGDVVMKVIDVTKADNGEITVQVEVQFSSADVQPQINQPVGQPIRGGNVQIQIAPVPPQAVPPQGAPNGVGAQPAVYNYLGLDMLDAKGSGLQLVRILNTRNQYNGTTRTISTTMVFKPQGEQEAAKLVFRGSRAATVDVPFLLKDVVLK